MQSKSLGLAKSLGLTKISGGAQILGLAAGAMALAGCSELTPQNRSAAIVAKLEPDRVYYGDDRAPVNQFGFYEARETGVLGLFDPGPGSSRFSVVEASAADMAARVAANPAANPGANPGQPEQSNQQIAYSYGFGFRIDSDEIKPLLDAHIAMCDEMGDACRVLRSSQARTDSWDGYGELKLQVAANTANTLADALREPAEELGGTLVSSVRNGEDLSEQIIDTQARIEARELLRGKLTEILRGNRGSVSELVEAERALADVNEELDAARQRLVKYQNRIQYSAVNIEYEPSFGTSQVGFVRPVANAFRSIGSTLGLSLAAIVYVLTAMAPVAALLLGLRWVLHRFGLRMRWWKNETRG